MTTSPNPQPVGWLTYIENSPLKTGALIWIQQKIFQQKGNFLPCPAVSYTQEGICHQFLGLNNNNLRDNRRGGFYGTCFGETPTIAINPISLAPCWIYSLRFLRCACSVFGKSSKNILHQMVVKNGDKSHGNPIDHLQQNTSQDFTIFVRVSGFSRDLSMFLFRWWRSQIRWWKKSQTTTWDVKRNL